MLKQLKLALKSNSQIAWVNSQVKAFLQKRRYERIVNHYRTFDAVNSMGDMMSDRGLTSSWAKSFADRRIRILFVGTDYNQDHGGFIQALRQVSDLYLFFRKDDSYGQYNPFSLYEGLLGRRLNTIRLLEEIENLHDQHKLPDIVIMQSLGASFYVSELLAIKQKYKFKVFNICLDDRLVFKQKTPAGEEYNYGSFGLIPLIDLALVANFEVVDWYLKENVPAIFFPMASSREVYYPIECVKKYDVGFIGANYGYRSSIIAALKRAGIDVHPRGDGWPEGKLSLDENNMFMNQCKIVLGIGTVGHCKDFYTSKLRDFEAPLSGAVYVTHNNPDLLSHYDDGDVILCNDEDEFIASIKSLLDDEEKMASIRIKSHEKAKNLHTYEHRFENLFDFLSISLERNSRGEI
jgi:spore maturation protein CgeB